MPLAKIISFFKGVCKKLCAYWRNTPYLLDREQANPELINPEVINPELINPEVINPETINPEAINPEKRHEFLVESLETESQQHILTNSQIMLAQIILVPTVLVQTILQENVMINISMLQDTLQSFVSSTPDVQGVALVSPDGLSLASVLPSQMDEERTAAMSASILSLGERIGGELARGNVERIVVRGEKGYSLLVGCGSEAVLLVLANSTAKKGLLFLESKRVVSQIIQLLSY